jgi:signal peptidase II
VIKFFFILILFIFDYFSKQVVFNLIDLNHFIKVNFFFDLAHIHNYGISFGLFAGILPSFILILIGSFISLFILLLFYKSENKIEKWSYIMILSGALSNIIDRAVHGYVIDFIYIHYRDFYWPAFNLADIYIFIGIFLILLQILKDLHKRTIK